MTFSNKLSLYRRTPMTQHGNTYKVNTLTIVVV
ncbi:hypothetical protein LINPERPRIM_LOCUS21876 [Linum perenne]